MPSGLAFTLKSGSSATPPDVVSAEGEARRIFLTVDADFNPESAGSTQ